MLLELFSEVVSGAGPMHHTWNEKDNYFSYFPWHSLGRASLCAPFVSLCPNHELCAQLTNFYFPLSLQEGMVVRQTEKWGTGASGRTPAPSLDLLTVHQGESCNSIIPLMT